MKKNVIGHMIASQEPASARIRRWNIFPKLVCLLLALVIWLAVVNIGTNAEPESGAPAGVTETQS